MKNEIISNKTPEDRVWVSNMPCIEFSPGNMSLHIKAPNKRRVDNEDLIEYIVGATSSKLVVKTLKLMV